MLRANWMPTVLSSHNKMPGNPVSVFETNIRVLGGLLSAYDLSKDWECWLFTERTPILATRVLLV